MFVHSTTGILFDSSIFTEPSDLPLFDYELYLLMGNSWNRYNDILLNLDKTDAILNQFKPPITSDSIVISFAQGYAKGKDIFRACCLREFAF